MPLTPVKVTFTLRTPMVVPNVDKFLDALLSWAAVQQAEFEDEPDPIALQHHIGIAKHHVGDQWCFMAGKMAYDWIGDPLEVHYIKRSRLSDYTDAWFDGVLNKRPYFSGSTGLTKAGSYLQPVQWVKTVSAYAVIDDMARFQELLPWVTHIGKLHHRDYGGVTSFDVTVDEAANDLWHFRNLPMGSPMAKDHIRGIGSLVSPYWSRMQHQEINISPS